MPYTYRITQEIPGDPRSLEAQIHLPARMAFMFFGSSSKLRVAASWAGRYDWRGGEVFSHKKKTEEPLEMLSTGNKHRMCMYLIMYIYIYVYIYIFILIYTVYTYITIVQGLAMNSTEIGGWWNAVWILKKMSGPCLWWSHHLKWNGLLSACEEATQFQNTLGSSKHTVDERNPAPVDRWFTLLFIGFLWLPTIQGGPGFFSIFWSLSNHKHPRNPSWVLKYIIHYIWRSTYTHICISLYISYHIIYHIISYHISYIIYHISYIIYHISYIIYHVMSYPHS